MIDLPVWQLCTAMLGTAGIGGVIVKLYSRWVDREREQIGAENAKRAQSDNVALGLIPTLMSRIEVLESARETDRNEYQLREDLCEARLSSLRHELRNVDGNFDSMLFALRHAPAERHAVIVAEMAERRAERRRHDEPGALREQVQREVSAANVIGDARERAAA